MSNITLTFRPMNCCGVTELTGINTSAGWEPASFFKELAKSGEMVVKTFSANKPATWGQAFYVMTYAWNNKHAKEQGAYYRTPKGMAPIRKLQQFIRDNWLGTLTIVGQNPSPRYATEAHSGGHTKVAMIYRPDHDRLWEYMREHGMLLKKQWKDNGHQFEWIHQ